MLTWLSSVLGIIVIDLVLSGDNAVVIGAAAAGLPRKQRVMAIVLGGGGAIFLRIVFASTATYLLQLPLLGVIGGVLLIGVAIHLLLERYQEQKREHQQARVKPRLEGEQIQKSSATEEQQKTAGKSLLSSVITIVIADVTMSLDNVLAVGGLANGNIPFLIVGLVFSVTFLLLGSVLVADLITRFPWLLDLACLIVGWAAAQIFLGDDSLYHFFESFPAVQIIAPAVAFVLVLLADLYLRRRVRFMQS